MRNPPPDWHADAKRLRAEGAHPTEIARAMGRAVSSVLYVLDEHGERERNRNRVRTGRCEEKPRAPRRAPKPILTVDQKMAVCRDFAAGRITRNELSHRLRFGLSS